MDAATIERLLKDFGFPIVATSALGWSVWATLRWVAGNLIIPVRDRSFSFLDRVEGNVDKMSDNLEKQTTALKDLNDKQSAIKDDIGRIAETCQMRCIHEGRFERNGDGRS